MNFSPARAPGARIPFFCAALGASAALGLLFAPGTARALPPADPTAVWTIQDENASISTASLTDRYYVNGLRIGWTSGTDTLPEAIENAQRYIWGDGRQRVSIDVSQQIFTPADTTSKPPPPGDRPYAGTLAATVALLNDTDHARNTFAASLGLIGPDAGARQVQNGFHAIIGQNDVRGWSYQHQNEPIGEVLVGRVWRYRLADFDSPIGGLSIDTLPEFTAAAGNVRIYAMGGFRVRIGQGLDSDFGPARLAPGQSGGDAFTPTRPFAWYIFGGADGQGVAHDITLEGNASKGIQSVDLKPFMGELEIGVGMMFSGVRLTYTQVFQTQEFYHQRGGLHQFGSIALSARF